MLIVFLFFFIPKISSLPSKLLITLLLTIVLFLFVGVVIIIIIRKIAEFLGIDDTKSKKDITINDYFPQSKKIDEPIKLENNFIEFDLVEEIVINKNNNFDTKPEPQYSKEFYEFDNWLKKLEDTEDNRERIVNYKSKCSVCGEKMDWNLEYCPTCGKKRNVIKSDFGICQICGEKMDKSANYCTLCGADPGEYIINFRGGKIPKYEADFLKDLERVSRRQFKIKKKVNEKMKMGFSVVDNHVNALCITYSEIERIPDSIINLKNLEILFVKWTKLETLPNLTSNLKSLSIINLEHNNIQNLPDSIYSLTSLEELYLKFNPIDDNTIGKLNLFREKGVKVIY